MSEVKFEIAEDEIAQVVGGAAKTVEGPASILRAVYYMMNAADIQDYGIWEQLYEKAKSLIGKPVDAAALKEFELLAEQIRDELHRDALKEKIKAIPFN